MAAQREQDKVDINLILPKAASRHVPQSSMRAQGLDYVITGLAPKKGKVSRVTIHKRKEITY